MGIVKVFVNGVAKNVASFSLSKELDRSIDTAKVTFNSTVVVNVNDKIIILEDVADLTNLQAIYHFEGHVRDESGYGNDAAGTAITYVSGYSGVDSAASFNGASSFLSITNVAGLTLAGQFEIRFWIKTTQATQGTLFDKRTSGTNGLAIFIGSVTAGKITVNAGSTPTVITSDSVVNDGKNHEVRVYRDSSNVIKIDIDNVTQSTTATVSGSLEVATNILIGKDYAGANFYSGSIAHPRIYTGGILATYDSKRIFNLKNIKSTIKFGGYTWKVTNNTSPRVIECKSFGKVIGETTVKSMVYNNQTIDYIVQDLIQNNTSLTFVKGTSTQISPTLRQFIATGYLLDLVTALASSGNKTFWTDGIGTNGQIHWDDNSAILLPITYTHGTNAVITISGKDDTNLVNKVTVKGQDLKYQNTETFSGDGATKVFTTAFVVSNPLIKVGSTVMIADQDYTYNSQLKQITFVNAPAVGTNNISVTYTYDRPITVQTLDQTSINTYGERDKEILAPWLATNGDATRFAALYIAAFKDVRLRVQVKIPLLDVQIDSNNVVTLVNSVKSINSAFTIKSITWEYPGITTLDCGEFTLQEYDLDKQVQRILHSLQQLQSMNTAFLNFVNQQETLTLNETIPAPAILSKAYYNSNSYYSNYQVYSE